MPDGHASDVTGSVALLTAGYSIGHVGAMIEPSRSTLDH
jgi:hypothetical protein